MRSPRVMLGLSVLLALALTSVSDPAAAQQQAGAPDAECASATDTATMRRCESARYQRARAALKASYQDLVQRLDGPAQAKLRAAQEAWERFREVNADFFADTARGGTLQALLRTTVLADMTEARSTELRTRVPR